MAIVKVVNARLSFPALFVPEAFKPGDALKYKATFLVPKDSPMHKEIDKAILETARTKWGAKAEAIIKSIRNNPNKFCFQDGDSKEYDGYEGMMALTAKSTKRPHVIDRNTDPLTEKDGRPYGGCYVDASVEFFSYEEGGNGISASIRWVQFRGDGDAFGGSTPVSQDEFQSIADGAMADDMV
jgi:hypothetical protein